MASLPTGFTAKLLERRRRPRSQTLGEAATESDRAAIPFLLADRPGVDERRSFVIDSVGRRLTAVARRRTTPRRDGPAPTSRPAAASAATRPSTSSAWYAAGIGAFALLVCALVGWYLIGRTFRPLTRIEDTAAGIAAGDLTRRVDVPDTDDEVASLSRSLNAMLARIEHSFAVREANEAKMRRFIADASHELRTPLAAVGGYAELYRQGALPTTEAVAGAMGRIESETHRMSGLVEDLLTLARLDGERPLELQPVDLAVLAADAAQDARTIDTGRPFAADRHRPAPSSRPSWSPTSGSCARSSPTSSPTRASTPRRRHRSRSSSAPSRAARPSGSHCTCATTAPAYPSPTASTVFERFYRADWSRSRHHGRRQRARPRHRRGHRGRARRHGPGRRHAGRRGHRRRGASRCGRATLPATPPEPAHSGHTVCTGQFTGTPQRRQNLAGCDGSKTLKHPQEERP